MAEGPTVLCVVDEPGDRTGGLSFHVSHQSPDLERVGRGALDAAQCEPDHFCRVKIAEIEPWSNERSSSGTQTISAAMPRCDVLSPAETLHVGFAQRIVYGGSALVTTRGSVLKGLV